MGLEIRPKLGGQSVCHACSDSKPGPILYSFKKNGCFE